MNDKYKGQILCRGSYVLGTACGTCARCKDTIKAMTQDQKPTDENGKPLTYWGGKPNDDISTYTDKPCQSCGEHHSLVTFTMKKWNEHKDELQSLQAEKSRLDGVVRSLEHECEELKLYRTSQMRRNQLLEIEITDLEKDLAMHKRAVNVSAEKYVEHEDLIQQLQARAVAVCVSC